MDFVPRTIMIGGKVLATMRAKNHLLFVWVGFTKHVNLYSAREICCFVKRQLYMTTSKNSAAWSVVAYYL